LDKALIPPLPQALGGWYAQPLDAVAAQRLGEQGRQRAQQAYRQRRSALVGDVEQLIAAFALGQAVNAELSSLLRSPLTPGERAMLLLIHGQLLISRRCSGAMGWLQQGFEAGRDLFLPADFFAVMRRHELLAELPLYEQPRDAVGLDVLLQEAAVIRRLRGPRRSPAVRDGADTVG